MKTVRKTKETEQNLENKKLTHFKSPPRKHQADDTEVGDDTPPPTTQGYAEKNVKRNPNDNKDAEV